MKFEIAVDVGGTFTDLILRDRDGRTSTFKSLTTPDRIADGIFAGLDLISASLKCSRGDLLADCSGFACGTTAATNAILEGKVAKTGLICTEGFRDTLLIREGGKSDSYDIYMDYPAPYIPRYLTMGVRERVNAEGGIEIPLDKEHVRRIVAQFKEWKVESIAVALLWSIARPDHELEIGRILEQEWPGIPVSLSHKVNPVVREYRRTSATAIDASLKVIVRQRLSELEARLNAEGFKGVLTFVTSNGGRASTEEILGKPVYLCLSGPSAAPGAASRLAKDEGIEHGNFLTTDMGGTSFDVSVVANWSIPMHREGLIDGHMFGVPSVDVKTIGAGGGSIARVDVAGLIHVGPESAGAKPGPACYGRGGEEATVTDANLVRGLLDPRKFAGGQMTLSVDRATKVIQEKIAKPLGMDVREAASLICLAAEQNMVAAIEDITVRRGVDPREFVYVSGGAAGGLHAAAIARELNMKRILIPYAASVLSAFGIATGTISFNFSHSLFASSAKFDFNRVNEVLRELEQEGLAFLERMSVAPADRQLLFTTQARYASQVWQLSLPLIGDRIENADQLGRLVSDFHQIHEQMYSVRAPHDAVEFIEWEVQAIKRPQEAIRRNSGAAAATQPKPDSVRSAYLKEAGGAIELPVYDRLKLAPGSTIAGPALVDDFLTTNLIPSEATARYTASGNLFIDLA